jgi:hypothetical protein
MTSVHPIPLPATAWLLLASIGSFGIAAWRRRRLAPSPLGLN